MTILKYHPVLHKQIIDFCAKALEAGFTIVYPTDTAYGIACDPASQAGLKKFYNAKERSLKQPVHVVVANKAAAKNLVVWNKTAESLARKFWPGPLSLILPIKPDAELVNIFSAGTQTLGIRFPDTLIARDLAKALGRPIPATSANPSAHLSGGYDSFSAEDVIKQFRKQKYQPNFVIDAGHLPKSKPSTLLKINANSIEILRDGPISALQIQKFLKSNKIFLPVAARG